MKKYIFLSALMLTAVLGFGDEKSDAVLAAMKKKFDSYTSYKLNFLADIEDDAMGLEGYVIVQGSKFNLNLRNTEVFYDGRLRYTLYKDYKEVIIENIGEADASLSSNPAYIFTSFFVNYDSEYLESVKISGKQAHRISVTPKTGNGFFTEAALVIDASSSQPLSVALEMPGMENDVVFRITSIEPNTRTSKETFTFDIVKHPDLEVIDFRD